MSFSSFKFCLWCGQESAQPYWCDPGGFVPTWWASHFTRKAEDNVHSLMLVVAQLCPSQTMFPVHESCCGLGGPLICWNPVPWCGLLAALPGSHGAQAVPTGPASLISLSTCSAQRLWTPAAGSLNGSRFCSWCLIILSVAQIEFCRWKTASYRSVFKPMPF